jgi:hypothetical protein
MLLSILLALGVLLLIAREGWCVLRNRLAMEMHADDQMSEGGAR